MIFERRSQKNQKHHQRGLFFYGFSVGIFAIIALITFTTLFVSGYSEQRIALLFLNLWFCLFTIDLVASKLRRSGEKAPWHDWACFKSNKVEDIKHPEEETAKS